MAAEELRKEGWHIDAGKLPDALGEEYSEALNAVKLKALLLDCDIREFGSAVLADRWDKSRSVLTGPLVLQLTKWRNASKSKYNDHVDNEGVCVLHLTDGHTTIRGMQNDPQPLHNITGDTPYGSKILLTGEVKLENDYLLLDNRNCKLFGGTVEKLVDRWNAERFGSSKNARKATGAPKWIPFGKSANKSADSAVASVDTKNFKAMEAAAPPKPTEGGDTNERSDEFEAARKANIEMAAKEQGGGKKFAQSHTNKKARAPKEEYTSAGEQDQPKRQESKPARNENHRRSPPGNRGGKFGARRGVGRRGRGNEGDDEFTAPRPSHGSTLFDYVQSQVQLPDIPPSAPRDYRPVSGAERNAYGDGDRYRQRRDAPGRRPSDDSGGARPSRGRFNFQDSPRGQYSGANTYGRYGDYSSWANNDNSFAPPRGDNYNLFSRHNERRGRYGDGMAESFDRMNLHGRANQNGSEESWGRYEGNNQRQQQRYVRTFTRTTNNGPGPESAGSGDNVMRGQPNRRQKRYSNEPPGQGSSSTGFHKSGKQTQPKIDEYWQNALYSANIYDFRTMFEMPVFIEEETSLDTLSVDTALEPEEKPQIAWAKGALCLAPWTDGNFYPAVIQQFGPVDLCTVFYTEYHNYSVVPVRKLVRMDRNP